MGPQDNAGTKPLKKGLSHQRQVRLRHCHGHDNMGEVLDGAPEMDTEHTENTTVKEPNVELAWAAHTRTAKCASDLQMRSENCADVYFLVSVIVL